MGLKVNKINKTKQYIIDSLFILMKIKSYKKISISEIAGKAGVTRATFYRYFKSKYDILKAYFVKQINIALDEMSQLTTDRYTTEYAVHLAFNKIYNQKDNLLLLISNDLIYSFLSVLTETIYNIFAFKSELYLARSIIFSGALFNFALYWLKSGCSTPIDQIEHLFIACIKVF